MLGKPCFYASPGRTCAQMARLRNSSNATGSADAGGAAFRINSAGADWLVQRYYTPELARLVTAWARPDLLAFGYEKWDGRGPLRLRSKTPLSGRSL